jgi:putative hydrolase of HD superfamily
MSMVFSDIQNLNTEKIIKMALLHDLAESITGDITPDKITKQEKNKIETDAIKNILQNLPDDISQIYFKIWNEYQKNCTSEAILLHEIDKLEMAFQAKSYQNQGISDEKIIPFLQPAIDNIKNKKVKEILNKFLEQ